MFMDFCFGANDVNAFRLAAEQNSNTQRLPDVSSITYEGIFNEYFFEIQKNKQIDVSVNALQNAKNNNTTDVTDDQKQSANNGNDDGNDASGGRITVPELSNLSQIFSPTFCYARTKLPTALAKAKRFIQNNPNKNKNKTNTVLKQTNDETNAVEADNDSNTNHDPNFEDFVHYLTIGLNENFDVNKMERNPLNLVIALDKSGSMRSGFTFDPSQKKDNKMKTANKAVLALLSHLRDNDRVSLLSFNSEAHIVKGLTLVKNIDMDAFKQSILLIVEGGGTNMEAAYTASTAQFSSVLAFETPSQTQNGNERAPLPYSNRIIFLTDAMPNSGSADPNSLMSLLKLNAVKHEIHTTFIGIGIDFNTKLVEQIIKVRGGNYYCIHSNEQFIETMDEEFKFMVTPIIYDFTLSLKTEGNACCIARVFGSGDDEKNNSKLALEKGQIMDVNTMFASPHDLNGEIKGGVILLRLKTEIDGDGNTDSTVCVSNEGILTYNIELKTKYSDVRGKLFEDQLRIVLDRNAEMQDQNNENENESYFDNNGIRKSVLLSHYVQFIHAWIEYEKEVKRNTSMRSMSPEFKLLFKEFTKHFKQEMAIISDANLEKEIKILDKFCADEDEETTAK